MSARPYTRADLAVDAAAALVFGCALGAVLALWVLGVIGVPA